MSPCTRRFLIALVLVALMVPVPAQAQEDPLRLDVALSPASTGTAVTPAQVAIKFPEDAADTAKLTAVVYLRNKSNRPLDGVKILSLLTPEPGQTLSPPAISLKAANANIPEAGLEIAVGAEVLVTVEVSDLFGARHVCR